MTEVTTQIPAGYVTPAFPSLSTTNANVLYYTSDIVYFCTLWSVILNSPLSVVPSILGYFRVYRKARFGIAIPVINIIWGLGTSSLTGALTGKDMTQLL